MRPMPTVDLDGTGRGCGVSEREETYMCLWLGEGTYETPGDAWSFLPDAVALLSGGRIVEVLTNEVNE
jgi:hypothetical protein